MQMDRLTIKSQEALQEAQRIAHGFSHQEVDGEHLLLALVSQSDSLIPELLEKIGVPVAKLRPDLEKELARRHKVQGTSSSDLYLSPNLKKALDARQGKIDPVIGRDDEIRRVMQVLTRRTKNNPVLIGEPGVGKTAIAEGLARRIV